MNDNINCFALKGGIMFEGDWWLLAARIVGTLIFVGMVIDFFVSKRKVPAYVVVLSIIALAGGIAYGIFASKDVLDIVLNGLLCFIVPFGVWFMCGGSVFAKRRGNGSSD